MPKCKKKSNKKIEKQNEIKIASPHFGDNTNNGKNDHLKHKTSVDANTLTSSLSLSSPVFSIQKRKTENFFNQKCLDLAKALLGQLLVRKVGGKRVSGFIVETECYHGNTDVASHSYKGRTKRNEPMFMKYGTSYVYSIYGMYYCFNISSEEVGSCVLIRALVPCDGVDEMHVWRKERRKAESKALKTRDLCNGPSKLCQALKIDKETCNKVDMTSPSQDVLWVEDGWLDRVVDADIVVTTRIGIKSSGEESAGKLLRFYVKESDCVSVRDKKAEDVLFKCEEEDGDAPAGT